MLNRHKYLLTANLFLLFIGSTAWVGCSDTQDPYVAKVNGKPITLERFKTAYRNFLDFTSAPDNLRFRFLFLHSLIDERLLLEYAEKNNLPEHIRHKEALLDIADQLLLNRLYETAYAPRITVTETELRELYRRSKIKLHVRHLHTKDATTIARLQERLQNGETWEALARECFQDPVLADNGGDLGFVKLGDLEPAFEDIAFTLPQGNISDPVQTSKGYSLIQVVEREVDPFLTEDDYQRQKGWLKTYAKSYLKRSYMRKITDQLLAELNVEFDSVGLDLLWNQLPEVLNSSTEPTLADAQKVCLRIRSRDEEWNLSTAIQRLRSLSQKQKKAIKNQQNLQTVLEGLIVQEALLEQAREKGLSQEPTYLTARTQAQETYLVKQVLNSVYNRVSNTNYDSLATLRWKAFLTFRDSLKQRASIIIDSTVVKTMVLPNDVS
ncbi:MAG: peptidylprolyl isomerase [Fidelibacterota bacterium]